MSGLNEYDWPGNVRGCATSCSAQRHATGSAITDEWLELQARAQLMLVKRRFLSVRVAPLWQTQSAR
jgi:hypothetical protein